MTSAKALLALLFLLGVCSLAPAQLGSSRWGPPVQWRNYRTGADSRVDRFTTTILNTQGDLDNFWQRNFGSPQAPRDVDFGKQLLIAINLGVRNTGGFGVYVQTIVRTSPSDIQVQWVEKTPQRGDYTTQAQTSPYIVIRVDRTAGQWSFSQQPYYSALSGVHIYQLDYPCDLPWQLYNDGGLCKITDGTTIYYDNSDDFGTFWQSSFYGDAGLPSAVDWQNEVIVGIALGRRPSTGYSIFLRGIQRISKTEVQVLWSEQTPPPGQINAQHVTSPYVLFRLPRSGDKVSFKKIPMGAKAK